MKHRTRDSTSVSVAIVLLILTTLAAVASGCNSGASASPSPTTVIVLSLGTTPDGGYEHSDTTKTVTLAPGQTLAVQNKHNDGPAYWSEMSGGSSSVLAPGGTVTVNSCPTNLSGRGSTTQKIYLARSPGTSTIVWTFGVDPRLPVSPSQPRVACPAGAASPIGAKPARCPIGVVRIAVTVT